MDLFRRHVWDIPSCEISGGITDENHCYDSRLVVAFHISCTVTADASMAPASYTWTIKRSPVTAD